MYENPTFQTGYFLGSKKIGNPASNGKGTHLNINFFAKELWRRVGVDQKSSSIFVVATRTMHLPKFRLDNVDPTNKTRSGANPIKLFIP